jgi:2-isopropylmalate synthase
VSDQSGRANILSRLNDIGMKVEPTNPKIQELLETLKQREFEGYVYDGAEASFALLAQRHLLGVPEFYTLKSFRVVDERVSQANGTLQTLSQATVEVLVNGETYTETATGNGPVNALDSALRRVLIPTFPALESVRLVDYKVRILTPNRGTEALTRVLIESRDTATGDSWVTVGVSPNVIDASYTALQESIVYFLLGEKQGL